MINVYVKLHELYPNETMEQLEARYNASMSKMWKDGNVALSLRDVLVDMLGEENVDMASFQKVIDHLNEEIPVPDNVVEFVKQGRSDPDTPAPER